MRQIEERPGNTIIEILVYRGNIRHDILEKGRIIVIEQERKQIIE